MPSNIKRIQIRTLRNIELMRNMQSPIGKHTHSSFSRIGQRSAYLIGGSQLEIAEDGQEDVPRDGSRDGQGHQDEGVLGSIHIDLRRGSQQRNSRHEAESVIQVISSRQLRPKLKVQQR